MSIYSGIPVFFRYYMIGALIIACILIEYYIHIVYGITSIYPHLYYVPVVMASLWWGLKGVLPVSVFLGVMHTASFLPAISEDALARSMILVFIGSVMGLLCESRKRSEDALANSEEKRRSFMESATDRFILLDSKMNVVETNQVAMDGLCLTRDEFIGKNYLDIVPELKNTLIHKKAVEVLKTGNVFFLDDFVIPSRFGEVCLSVKIFKVGNGLGIIYSDVTERKKMEKELKIKDNSIQTSINAIAFTDLKGNVTYVNESFLKMWGYESLQEILGLNIMKYIASDKTAMQMYEKTGESRTYFSEITAKRRDGSHFDVQLSANIVKDDTGKPICVMASFIDITERKKLEKDLTSSLEHYSAIVNTTHSVILELDRKGGLVFNNPEASRFLKQDNTSLRCKSLTDVFPSEFASDVRNRLTRIFDSGLPQQYESTLAMNEMQMDVLVHMVPIGPGKEPESVMFSLRDISDLKAAERLRMENAALEDASRLKSEFMATVSHELRTPMNAVIGYTELLQDSVFGELNEKQQQQLGVIHNNGEKLLLLLGDIMDNANIEAGKLELKYERIGVDDLVSMAREARDSSFIEKNLKVEVFGEQGLSVWADGLRIKQCLNNLLSNAVKFTPEGGYIQITTKKKGDMVEFSVKDDGIGFPPENLKVIFEPFVRIESAPSEEVEATGLGLIITKRLVENMGGRVWAKSVVGEGSEFGFSIPASTPDEKAGQSTV